ncbi:MFS transporter [Cumulibacter manganitolerans]|uniref:MFS transporter n=1 Tax=Cumulibacter manganitolerans TaxID=1884992 RepID=UPI001296555D|nr:MFS transporter [Cumulibacter manganitolerans]
MTTDETALAAHPPASKKKILSWALWDWGTQPYHTVITTFVFSVYITSDSFGSENTTSTSLAVATAVAGVLIALLAPVLGQNADRKGRNISTLRNLTWLLSLISAALFFVKPHPGYLWVGLGLLALGSVVAQVAEVNYNSAMDDIATEQNVGKISGFGWGMGYLGGIIVLLLIYFLFISPDVGLFGVTGDEGLDIRVSMVVCGLWTLLFTIPTFVSLKDKRKTTIADRVGIVESYRLLGRSIARIWRSSPHTIYFLLASALFRDGLAGVFTFGAVIAARTYGFGDGEVIIFGAVANIVAGLATIAFGVLDDRIGPKRVILISLGSLVVLGTLIFFLHDSGKAAFWVCGMLMTIFVGPAQSASRTFLARIIPEGKAGEIFGLYATTGRAISFFAPTMFGLSVAFGAAVTDRANTQYWGILGVVLVLLAGFLVMLPVRERQQITDLAPGSIR